MTRRNFDDDNVSNNTGCGKHIRFTADAIEYLSGIQSPIDLESWTWHLEVVNGIEHVIITDKLVVDATLLVTKDAGLKTDLDQRD